MAPSVRGRRVRHVLVVAAAVLASAVFARVGRAEVPWQACGSQFECGRVTVPLDYAKPAGRQIRIALIRLPAADPARRIGSLFVNPGGPGASGVDFLRSAAGALSPALRARFDVVGFDPRGVGRSSPVRCRSDAGLDREAALDLTPDTPAERDAVVADARSFARECAERSGAILPFVSTDAAARDLDALREAVGDERLTYLGFSYGTFLGATYAGLFSDRVRALALDGAVDPEAWAGDSATLLRAQAIGFEKAYRAFLAATQRHREWGLAELGDPAVTVEKLLESLDDKPLPVGSGPHRRLLTEQQAIAGISAGLYSSESWNILATALSDAWARDDGARVLALSDQLRGRRADGRYTNLVDAYTAVSCVDHAPAPRSAAPFEALALELSRISPLEGAPLGYEELPCAFWPVEPSSRFTGPFTAAGAPPILVVGTTGDPATPYQWAKALARELRSGVLLTRRGQSHVAYDESRCIRVAVDRYLLTGRPPADGSVCGT